MTWAYSSLRWGMRRAMRHKTDSLPKFKLLVQYRCKYTNINNTSYELKLRLAQELALECHEEKRRVASILWIVIVTKDTRQNLIYSTYSRLWQNWSRTVWPDHLFGSEYFLVSHLCEGNFVCGSSWELAEFAKWRSWSPNLEHCKNK